MILINQKIAKNDVKKMDRLKKLTSLLLQWRKFAVCLELLHEYCMCVCVCEWLCVYVCVCLQGACTLHTAS